MSGTWYGCVPLQHAGGACPPARADRRGITPSIAGNRGALVRQENQGEWAHFFLATYWQDLAAVKAFAGEDYHVAVTYPDDDAFELLSDPYVFQHEVEAVSPL
ncbi:hypothetical protein MJ584_11180 [Klebsiella pneumoniae]|nr:hypothetical protein MJ584_11180 [Klebsiella pneumoniae]